MGSTSTRHTQWDSLLDVCRELQDAVFVKDLEGRYMMVNDAVAASLGRDVDELVGRTDDEIFPGESEGLRANDDAVLAGASLTIEEAVVVDGEMRTYLSSKAPLKDSSGSVIGLIGISTDITARKAMEEELRMSEARLEEAQAVGRVGSWELDLVRERGVWSKQLCEIYGVDPQTFNPNREMFRALVHPDDIGRLDDAVARAVEEGEAFEVEHRILRPDGRQRIVLCRGHVFLDVDGTALRMVGATLDITERLGAANQLVVRERQLAAAQELAGVGSFEWDPTSGRLAWSRELFRIFGVSSQSFEPSFEGYLEFVHPDDRAGREAAIEQALRDGSASGQHRIVRADGEVRWLDSRLGVVRDAIDDSPRVIGACRDVTEQRSFEENLREQVETAQARALVDPLTGVGNRRLALERLAHALALAERRGSPLAVLFVDLDAFKQINDEFGHAAGDRVLTEVARRLDLRLRRSDTLARIGGDEFLVICENTNASGGRETASRLEAAFSEPFPIQGAERQLGVSIGQAIAQPGDLDPEALIAAADDAMYAARTGAA